MLERIAVGNLITMVMGDVIQALSFQLSYTFQQSTTYEHLHQGTQPDNPHSGTQPHKIPCTIQKNQPEKSINKSPTSSLARPAYKTPPRNGSELRDTSPTTVLEIGVMSYSEVGVERSIHRNGRPTVRPVKTLSGEGSSAGAGFFF